MEILEGIFLIFAQISTFFLLIEPNTFKATNQRNRRRTTRRASCLAKHRNSLVVVIFTRSKLHVAFYAAALLTPALLLYAALVCSSLKLASLDSGFPCFFLVSTCAIRRRHRRRCRRAPTKRSNAEKCDQQRQPNVLAAAWRKRRLVTRCNVRRGTKWMAWGWCRVGGILVFIKCM